MANINIDDINNKIPKLDKLPGPKGNLRLTSEQRLSRRIKALEELVELIEKILSEIKNANDKL